MPKIQFRLEEFKKVGEWIERSTPFPISYVLCMLLRRLEDRAWVPYRVEKAIDAYRASEPPLVEPPEYYEEESEVQGLPILQLKAPWTSKN